MDFDRPWLKHGLLSEGVVVFWEPKTIFCYAFALPNNRQYDPEILCFLDASSIKKGLEIVECTFSRTNGISELFKHGVPDCCQNDNVKKGSRYAVAPPGVFWSACQGRAGDGDCLTGSYLIYSEITILNNTNPELKFAFRNSKRPIARSQTVT